MKMIQNPDCFNSKCIRKLHFIAHRTFVTTDVRAIAKKPETIKSLAIKHFSYTFNFEHRLLDYLVGGSRASSVRQTFSIKIT